MAGRLRDLAPAGPFAAAILVGLGLALEVGMARDLLEPRHASGAVAGVQNIAAQLPPNAVVIFPMGQAGIHVAMPLGYDFGVDAFAIPSATMTGNIRDALARMEQAGKLV